VVEGGGEAIGCVGGRGEAIGCVGGRGGIWGGAVVGWGVDLSTLFRL